MIMNRKKYKSLKDEELVQAYTESPTSDILQVLYERYGHLVLGLCIKYLKQVEDAEDLCANIFEKLPQLITKHEIRYFKSWLYQVSRNECLMVLRKKDPHFKEIEDALLADNHNQSLKEKEEQEQALQKMDDAIQRLKKDQRDCITLFFIEEKSYQEVSALLHMTVKSVKSHIQNGKRNLKILMEAKP